MTEDRSLAGYATVAQAWDEFLTNLSPADQENPLVRAAFLAGAAAAMLIVYGHGFVRLRAEITGDPLYQEKPPISTTDGK